MEKLTLKEFKYHMINARTIIYENFIGNLHKELDNFKLKTQTNIKISDYLILEVKIPKTKKDWDYFYNKYLENCDEKDETMDNMGSIYQCDRYTTEELVDEAIQWYKYSCEKYLNKKHSLRDFKKRYVFETLDDFWENDYTFIDELDNYIFIYLNSGGVLKKELKKELKRVSLKDFDNGKDFKKYKNKTI